MQAGRSLLLLLTLLSWGGGAAAAGLQAMIDEAAPGEVIDLAGAAVAGPTHIDKPLTLENGSVEGDGKGSVITIEAPDVVLRSLTVTGSGLSLETMDAAVKVKAEGDRAMIEASRLEDNLIGVHLEGPDDAVVRHNSIVGRQDLRMSERGNGVYVWNSPGSIVEGNDIRHGRDGIFANTSKRNAFRDNHFEDLRFAVHYMYTDRSLVTGNVSIGNHIGYAIMYSTHVTVTDNVSLGDRDHGVMLNYANSSTIEGNRIEPDEAGRGPEKCVFIYNANKNRITGNSFAGCAIGVHFTAGSERNVVAENAFIGNETQVKYVGSRWLDWSESGRGNYWSDNTAFDLNGDGIADAPYRPNDLVDQIVWRQPLAKLLLTSPAVQVLRWAQSQFPALLPGGVIDTAPLMRPPSPAPYPRTAALAR